MHIRDTSEKSIFCKYIQQSKQFTPTELKPNLSSQSNMSFLKLQVEKHLWTIEISLAGIGKPKPVRQIQLATCLYASELSVVCTLLQD